MMNNIKKTIMKIKEDIPNSYVNVLGVLDISKIYNVLKNDDLCERISNITYSLSCPIITSLKVKIILNRVEY